jgi:hypothetical protein
MYRAFPRTLLDGEIWYTLYLFIYFLFLFVKLIYRFGRGYFSEAQKTVYAQLLSIEWALFRHVHLIEASVAY